MTNALTPEQIELLRGLPTSWDERLYTPEEYEAYKAVKSSHRREAVDLLLATIDTAVAAERERVLKAIVGDLENAATDCDGHTPYSILMALAEEIRAEHSANPQGETDQ